MSSIPCFEDSQSKSPIDWCELLEQNQFEKISDSNYKNHYKNNLANYLFVGNFTIDLSLFPTGNLQPVWDSDLHKYNKNLDNYQKQQSLKVNKYNEPSEQCRHISSILHLKHCHIACNTQPPNGIVGMHTDMNRSFTHFCKENSIELTTQNIKKYIIFLEDWQIGQTFMIGSQTYTDWKKFDCISWPWYMPHATCNASNTERKILFIVGI